MGGWSKLRRAFRRSRPRGVTLCLTAGGRPDLLKRTLRSLLPYNGHFFEAAIVTNDRGDAETDTVVRSMLPSALLLSHTVAIGEFKCVDEMAALATTPYIFHCEDDWFFDPVPFIPIMLAALTALPRLSSVSARQTGSLNAHYGRERDWQEPVAVGGGWIRQLAPTEAYRGLSFNPHLYSRAFWQEVGPWGRHSREQAINDDVEASGYSRAFLVPGVYEHLGAGRHMENPR